MMCEDPSWQYMDEPANEPSGSQSQVEGTHEQPGTPSGPPAEAVQSSGRPTATANSAGPASFEAPSFPPDVLANALQDTVHQEIGKVRVARTVREEPAPTPRTLEQATIDRCACLCHNVSLSFDEGSAERRVLHYMQTVMQKMTVVGPPTPRLDNVICPGCAHQFQAISMDDQATIADLHHDIERAVATNAELATENADLRKQVEEAQEKYARVNGAYKGAEQRRMSAEGQVKGLRERAKTAEAALAEERAKWEKASVPVAWMYKTTYGNRLLSFDRVTLDAASGYMHEFSLYTASQPAAIPLVVSQGEHNGGAYDMNAPAAQPNTEQPAGGKWRAVEKLIEQLNAEKLAAGEPAISCQLGRLQVLDELQAIAAAPEKPNDAI